MIASIAAGLRNTRGVRLDRHAATRRVKHLAAMVRAGTMVFERYL